MEIVCENNPYESIALAYYYYEGKYTTPDYEKTYEYLKVDLSLKNKEGDGTLYNASNQIEDSALELLADMFEHENYLDIDIEKSNQIIRKLYDKHRYANWYDERLYIFDNYIKISFLNQPVIDEPYHPILLLICYKLLLLCSVQYKYIRYLFL